MAEKFFIKGTAKINGEIEVYGSKNAAGAVISAALLTNEPTIINNVPLVSDILNLLNILEEMGAIVEWLEPRTVRITAGGNMDPGKLNFEKFSKTRVSVLLIGALTARFQEFKVSRPGGDRIGLRPITTHLEGIRDLGVSIEERDGCYIFKRGALQSKEIVLSEFSVTATENLMLAASLASGKTVIKMAAAEPQVQNLGEVLSQMGVDIRGVGTHTITINGQDKVKGIECSVIPDPLEAGTFIALGAVIAKRLRIKNVISEHLVSFLKKLEDIGAKIERGDGFVVVEGQKDFKPARVQSLPYPGFPTDLLPLIVPLLTQATGKSLIHDPLYENRFNYIQELRKMGADIEIVDPHRAFVFGKTALHGNIIHSWDIRAGASLVIAGLLADGSTTLEDVEQIDRGYERIEERLQALGADIKRITT
ncbi:MAG: UDP-N-acetylglucosamine 1-carboxyvinyltransferase [Patescibacteria group bacterium]